MLRPKQWIKNLMLYFPPFLGGTLLLPGKITSGLMPFFSFCMVSSSAYILNDILDRSNDLHHPEKRNRPLAAGTVSVFSAWALAALCLLTGIISAYTWSSPLFTSLLLVYLIVTLSYSLRLREFALLDIFCISAGFLLRLEAGGAAFEIKISEWLFLTVFLLALFLSTGKRLSEKRILGNSATNHRKALDAYPEGFLEGAMYMAGASVLVTYSMYVLNKGAPFLVYTVPLCSFGLLRYILRIKSGEWGDPTDSLLKDIPLLCAGLLWAAMIGWGVYAS
jgi:4-hydroxybenzoate polyprenyltransferase